MLFQKLFLILELNQNSDPEMKYPILYSFRRCPYAMRARMALAYSGIIYEHREILLKNRPKDLYDISAKGTVPVLQVEESNILEESLDIMKWALKISDNDYWYKEDILVQDTFIYDNDRNFKSKLDKYKYHIRYPELSFEEHRLNVIEFLEKYDYVLKSQIYLINDKISLADIAIFPFIRQCANVDFLWFQPNFPNLNKWLDIFKDSNLFKTIMNKFPIWDKGNNTIIINKSI